MSTIGDGLLCHLSSSYVTPLEPNHLNISEILNLVPPEQIPRIHLLLHVRQERVEAVGEDDVALGLEGGDIVHHLVGEEVAAVRERRLVDDDRYTVGFQVLDDVLDGRGSEVVGVALHREAIDSHDLRLAFEDRVGDEFLADGIALHHGLDHGLRDVLVVGEQLLGVLGQAVAAVAEAGVVVVRADARVHADSFDYLLRIQPLSLGVGVQLVEIADAYGEVGVGEKLDGFSLGGVRNQGRDVLVLGALLEQPGEHFGLGLLVLVGAHDNAARVEVVVKSLAFAEEFGREDDVVHAVLLANGIGIPYGNGRFDDHQHVRVDTEDVLDGVLDGGGVEEVVFVVVIGRGGDHHELCGTVGRIFVHGGAEVELALALPRLAEETLDLVVLDRADEIVQLIRLPGGSRYRHHLMMLGEQNRE